MPKATKAQAAPTATQQKKSSRGREVSDPLGKKQHHHHSHPHHEEGRDNIPDQAPAPTLASRKSAPTTVLNANAKEHRAQNDSGDQQRVSLLAQFVKANTSNPKDIQDKEKVLQQKEQLHKELQEHPQAQRPSTPTGTRILPLHFHEANPTLAAPQPVQNSIRIKKAIMQQIMKDLDGDQEKHEPRKELKRKRAQDSSEDQHEHEEEEVSPSQEHSHEHKNKRQHRQDHQEKDQEPQQQQSSPTTPGSKRNKWLLKTEIKKDAVSREIERYGNQVKQVLNKRSHRC